MPKLGSEAEGSDDIMAMVSEMDAGEPLHDDALKGESLGPSNQVASNVKLLNFTGREALNGFRAKLSGATIADLVQMECLAGTRLVARVTSADRTGYLFFEGGQLIHAELGRLRGEDAALDILRLSGGEFEAVERAWPRSPTIQSKWQGLLLRAAQASDEDRPRHLESAWPDSGRRPTAPSEPSNNPTDVPVSQRVSSTSHSREEMPNSTRQPSMRVTTRSSGASPNSLAPNAPASSPPASGAVSSNSGDSELQALPVLRLDAQGNVITNRRTPKELAEVVAYAWRLTDLIGEDLGLDRFRALECQFAEQSCVSFFADNGDLISVMAPSKTDISRLKRKLQL